MFDRLKKRLDETAFVGLDNIIKKLDKYEYISFDIFDTLIKRDVYRPTEVFGIVEKKLGIEGFATARTEAEKEARRVSGKADICLEEIYEQLAIVEDKKTAMKMERECEINLCTVNRLIKTIYDWCILNGKRVVIISDMYLDEFTITEILHQNDIKQYYRLFISNVVGKTKQSGSLYDEVVNTLGINKRDIVHIGNAFVADYLRAKKLGVDALKVKTTYNRMYKYAIYCRENDTSVKNLESFINNHISGKDFYFDYGYGNFGPALVGFCGWLLEALKQQKRDIAIFLGRDGYIMKVVYDMLGYDKEIPSTYVEVSRRCFRILDFIERKGFEEIYEMLPLRKLASIAEYIDCLCLDVDDCKQELQELGLDENDMYIREDFSKKNEIKEFYYRVQDKVVANAVKEKENLELYLGQFDFNSKVGLIDVGWGGTIQHYLEDLLAERKKNIDILGYYWGVGIRAQELLISNNANRIRAQGYFFDCLRGAKYNYQRPFDGLIETLFLQQIGSVKNYKKEGNEIMINRLEYEYINEPNNTQMVKEIQEGAIRFVEEYMKSYLFETIDFDAKIMFYNLFQVCSAPSRREIEAFKDVNFYDSGNCKKLFNDYSLLYSMLHPKKFIHGYYDAYWKIGYLKNIFRIKLPYMDICLKYLPWLRDLRKRPVGKN